MCTEMLHESLGNRTIKEAVRLSGVVSPAAEDTDLVLDLNHQISLSLSIGFSQMSH